MDLLIQLKEVTHIPLSELQVLANNRAIAQNLRDVFPNPYTLRDAADFINLANKGMLGYTFGIFAGDIFIGVGSIVPQEDVYRNNGEIGYWIGEPYWRKGYGTEAVKLLTRFAFDELRLLRVFANVFSENVASMKVLEKAQYSLEAVLRYSILKNGIVSDGYLYSILNKASDKYKV